MCITQGSIKNISLSKGRRSESLRVVRARMQGEKEDRHDGGDRRFRAAGEKAYKPYKNSGGRPVGKYTIGPGLSREVLRSAQPLK